MECGYEEADESEGRMARGTNIAVVWTLEAADGTTMNTKIADLMCVISTSGHYGVKKRTKTCRLLGDGPRWVRGRGGEDLKRGGNATATAQARKLLYTVCSIV